MGRGIFGPIIKLNDNNFLDFTVSFMLLNGDLWGFLGIPINGDGDFGIFFRIPKNPQGSGLGLWATALGYWLGP